MSGHSTHGAGRRAAGRRDRRARPPPAGERLRRPAAGCALRRDRRRAVWPAAASGRDAGEGVDGRGEPQRGASAATAAASPWSSARRAAAARGSGGAGTPPCTWPCRRRPGSRERQPLQDRHRSSASDLRRPPAVRDDLARPASRAAAGPARGWSAAPRRWPGTTGTSRRPPGTGVRTALGDADAAAHGGGEVAVVVRVAELDVDGARAAAAAKRRFASSGAGRTRMPGLSRPSGSQTSLNRSKRPTSSGPYILRQQFGAGLAVAVLAGQRAAVRHDQVGQLLGEPPEAARRRRAVSRSKSIRTWMQPSPKWP